MALEWPRAACVDSSTVRGKAVVKTVDTESMMIILVSLGGKPGSGCMSKARR